MGFFDRRDEKFLDQAMDVHRRTLLLNELKIQRTVGIGIFILLLIVAVGQYWATGVSLLHEPGVIIVLLCGVISLQSVQWSILALKFFDRMEYQRKAAPTPPDSDQEPAHS